MERPIFYDQSGRRGRWARSVTILLILALLLLSAAFAATLAGGDQIQDLLPADMHRNLKALSVRVSKGSFTLKSLLPKRKHHRPALAGGGGGQVRAAFYVPWDPASRLSLQQHVDELDWVVPATITLEPGKGLHFTPDARLQDVIAGAKRKPVLLPMVQNSVDDKWDGEGTARLLADPAQRARFLASLIRGVQAMHGGGIVYDLESLPASSLANYRVLLAETKRAFAPLGWVAALAVPADDPDWDLGAFARVSDRLFLMSYDEHAGTGDPGPIASQAWFAKVVRHALASVPPGKLIVGIGNYTYDWHGGQVEDLSAEEAWLEAHDSSSRIGFDPASGNASFSFEDDGEVHQIWMLDAASAWNELKALQGTGIGGIALWRLGSEDPGLWPVLNAPSGTPLPRGALALVQPVSNVDVEGNGELLRIGATPDPGRRAFDVDPRGFVRGESWQSLPTPFVVRRGGNRPGLVALTFDDGPDAEWTPAILDALEAQRVPGTFFIIGENAVDQRALLQRIVADGGEIGNHSYTHPNLATLTPREIGLELKATRRLIEAYTGRSTRLFRAPYFGDAEPTTPDELLPALVAQQAGYLNVGLHVDPDDWQRPSADEIAQRVISAVESGSPNYTQQIVLLHDGGGDRSQTVAALPKIISALRAKGYRFGTVSELAGLKPADVMPPVPADELRSVRADLVVFSGLAAFETLLAKLFLVAIGLGLARALFLAALALWDRRRAAPPPPIVAGRFVSVLIPAFNEARVIESSVLRVLASEEVELEVIVIDDGSSDETGAIVSRAFAGDERVRLLTLPNGGKARALNRGLAIARGDVVIALDADTQFEPLTIARLARWFEDETIGAVAGNAKVGNRVNIVTRWQAVEYVTAQNLERRALDRLRAITVVPGAVGAWRREALDAVGGYPPDTLAEDQDLTIAVQRAGWRIEYDPQAVAWTEAPQSFRALARQRFRWAYGTLQCLWKHRAILSSGQPRGLARIGIPQAWLFQIGFALVSPLIDLALVTSLVATMLRVEAHGWAQTSTDVFTVAAYWLVFTAIDALCGFVAYRLDGRERRYPVFLLLAQRFVYRQIMYFVVVRAVSAAIRGSLVGWGKLERKGTVLAS